MHPRRQALVGGQGLSPSTGVDNHSVFLVLSVVEDREDRDGTAGWFLRNRATKERQQSTVGAQ